jgi:prepilin-type N-terminal cleavage/methylation domain-containing protein
MQRDKRVKKGFTLLEILLVIAAIGILAAIVLVAINPTKQLAQVRNTKRVSDINSLYKAIEQRTIDIGGAYPGDIGIYKDICPIGVNTNCVDLSGLVTTYIAAIPLDPSGGNYKIGINPDNNRISIKAPNIELGRPIILNEILMTVEYLVVGGGGGGGKVNSQGNHAGGGGAGGVLAGSITVKAQNYTITVGNGGATQTSNTTGGNAGENSSLGSLVIANGGGGGNSVSAPNKNGGSGGGASTWVQVPETGISGQGYAGGLFSGPVNTNAGGGGGAGGVGGNGNGVRVGGAGGVGVQNSISGTAVWYAGGGGGAGGDGNASSSGGAGGSGVGGNGMTFRDPNQATNIAATAGTNGTGSGGGGGSNTNGAAGGSGIVIIRYKTDGSDGISPSSTGGTKTTVGEYTIHTFTTSGTFTIAE